MPFLHRLWLLGCLSALCAPSAWSRDPTLVPEDFKFCSRDSDCQIIPLRCACCTYDAIHKLHAADYYAMPRDCVDPPCTCADHHWRAACEKGQCVLADRPVKTARATSRPAAKPVQKPKLKPRPKAKATKKKAKAAPRP